MTINLIEKQKMQKVKPLTFYLPILNQPGIA